MDYQTLGLTLICRFQICYLSVTEEKFYEFRGRYETAWFFSQADRKIRQPGLFIIGIKTKPCLATQRDGPRKCVSMILDELKMNEDRYNYMFCW